jgi:hypothetical protein
VTDDDARNLAAALERSLDDIPDHDAIDHKTRPIEEMPGLRAVIDDDVSPIEWFSGKAKIKLQHFIEAWKREGGFRIS